MRRRASPPSAAEPVEVRIERIGAEGDGVAALPDGSRVHIPLTLPGELARVVAGATRDRASARPGVMAGEACPGEPAGGPPSTPGCGAAAVPAILQPSPDRIVPPCPHFGTCGGCVLQHWRDDAYAAWKSDLLRDALRRAGFADAPIAPMARTAPGERRRMDLAAQRTPRGIAVGLHRRESRAVVDLGECPVLNPSLSALFDPLRALLPRLRAVRREASVVANLLDAGVDLLLRTDAPVEPGGRALLVAFARAQGLVRVSVAVGKAEPEPVAVLAPPRITLSGVPVDLPPGGFLQATTAGEAAIIGAVLAGLPEVLPARARVTELYAGSGSLTFALAQRARVTAFEGDAAAASALRQAANRAGLGGRVAVTQRDLARQPVPAAELGGFTAVVLDPPFAGAAAQTGQIAAGKPGRVVYVSCNPAVLARDARLLREAGYGLLAATPVDQFLWSARLESVCVFGRNVTRPQRAAALYSAVGR